MRKYFWLEKLPIGLCQQDKVGRRLLNAARKDIVHHLLSENGGAWKSGYLTDDDVAKIEGVLQKKIRCSPESGEYFYRVE